ncbi:DUF262 domain-containing protein [Actinopolyspora halophila]|uniref:DUF262 domain-containing protein n=1 Tax=Actinopolyspora halophila TaxID=1850 RepID=UPI0003A82E8B|nr:DUF262 domain-containing protein [Actinopolyspora halophila]
MKQLEANEVPLHKIFSSDYDFRIPDYQRPYAWEPEQAGQLFADLVEALENDQEEQYFLGSIVLVKPPNTARCDVIDGQQRLTTLTILLAVLRDLAAEEQVAAKLDEMLREAGNPLLGLESKPRLRLRPRDAGFFRRYVQERNGSEELVALRPETLDTESQRCIRANLKAFRDELVNWSDVDRQRLGGLVASRTYLVVVQTSDVDSAHRIFSVMNDRGLDLSPADIFKSKVIGALPEGVSDEYAVKWEDTEQSLGRDEFAGLFVHLRMLFAKERGKRVLLKEFPEHVLDRYLPEHAKEFVDEVLLPYAEAYESIRDRSYSAPEDAERINAWFGRLAQLDNSDWIPPALWALRWHAADTEWLDAFFRKLERLATSMFIRRVYTSPRADRYAELLRELDAGHGLDADSFELKPNEKRDTLACLDGELYLSKKVRKYVLLRLDETLAGADAGATYDGKVVTVEHVLPQNPKEGSAWLAAFTEEQREYWTHRIANLVLLNRRKNSQAQNYEFGEKRGRYFFAAKSGATIFVLTNQLLSVDEWTPALLEQRQRELVGVLAEEWGLD